MKTRTMNVLQAIEAQKEYVKNAGIGFAPENGICFRCHQQIYSDISTKTGNTVSEGISVEKASSTTITSCPHCNTSFV